MADMLMTGKGTERNVNDAIRMYQQAAGLPEWALNVGVQIVWIFVLRAIGRAMWRRQLNSMIVQGG